MMSAKLIVVDDIDVDVVELPATNCVNRALTAIAQFQRQAAVDVSAVTCGCGFGVNQ
jgi:hypothetical protein